MQVLFRTVSNKIHAKDIEDCRTASSKTSFVLSHPSRREEVDRTGLDIRVSESNQVASVGDGWTETKS